MQLFGALNGQLVRQGNISGLAADQLQLVRFAPDQT
jgi:hypothetical protein